MPNKHGLFQRGVHPSAEMRAKMSAAQKRRWAEQPDPEMEAFIAHVQRLIDECYRRMGNGHAVPRPRNLRPGDGRDRNDPVPLA